MNIIIMIEYVINLIILLVFYMHMFQLNSYFNIKHLNWLKNNYKKIIIQELFIIFTIPLIIAKKNYILIISAFILAISIIYNFPKKKSKVKFNITNRVKRMFFAEIIIILTLSFNKISINILFILNIISPIMCIIVNIISYPIEYLIKKRYVIKAKKKLEEIPNLTIIGITGSYGKTSVKNDLYTILSKKYNVLVTPKNYNTTLGVVKTILEELSPIHEVFLCEMGATKIGDIKEICKIVNPNIGIITAIAPQHIQSFKNIKNVIKTKFELAEAVENNNGIMFLNYNNEYIKDQKVNSKVITYGTENENLDYYANRIVNSQNGLEFYINNSKIKFNTKLLGKHNVENITASIAVANHLGITFEQLQYLVENLKTIPHRLELINNGNITILDDSYNSNPISSKAALTTLKEFSGIKAIITPGLIELGKKQNEYNKELGNNIANVCDYVFIVGKENKQDILNGLIEKNFNEENIKQVNTPQQAMQQIINISNKKQVTILIENDLPDNYNL